MKDIEKFGQRWRMIDCADGLYLISSKGSIWSIDSRCFLKPLLNKRTGYLYVKLKQNGKRKNLSIHRLVAEAFIDNPKGKAQVNHKDENKRNNSVENLNWVSQWENLSYGTHHKKSALSRSKKPEKIAENLAQVERARERMQLVSE